MANTPIFREFKSFILTHAGFLSKVYECCASLIKRLSNMVNAFTVLSHCFSSIKRLLSKTVERAHVLISGVSIIHPMLASFRNTFTAFANSLIQVCERLVSIHCETIVFLHCFNIIIDSFSLSANGVFTCTKFCYENILYFSNF